MLAQQVQGQQVNSQRLRRLKKYFVHIFIDLNFNQEMTSSLINLFQVVTESGLMVPDRYWGSYRPGNYFGLKTREPNSPVVGLMWYFPNRIGSDGISIR